MKYILLIAALLLSACSEKSIKEEQENAGVPDQCMRREIFKECMQSLPAGPVATHYNDWDEVVSECETTAYHQSIRMRKLIKPECRAY